MLGLKFISFEIEPILDGPFNRSKFWISGTKESDTCSRWLFCHDKKVDPPAVLEFLS